MKGVVVGPTICICPLDILPLVKRGGGIVFQRHVTSEELETMDIDSFLELVPIAIAPHGLQDAANPRQQLAKLISLGKGRPATSHMLDRVHLLINKSLKKVKYDDKYFWLGRCKVKGIQYFQLWVVDWEDA